MELKEEIEILKNYNLPIIIFGAGIIGECAYYVLKANGINPICYADNNEEKQGKYLFDLEIKSLDEIRNQFSDCVFVVAISLHKEIMLQLNDKGYFKVLDSVSLVKTLDISKYSFSRSHQEVEGYIGSYLRHRETQVATEKEVKILEICWLITQRCSLRCAGCANLMHYYMHPNNISVEKNIRSLQKILDSVDFVERVSITGGEATVHPEFEKMLEWALLNDKIGNVTMFTNCTVIPSENALELFKNPKMYVSLSDYGEASRKFDLWNELMKKNNINYNVVKERIWKDYGDLKCRNRSKDETDKLFKRCIYEGSYSLMNGKLSYCARCASGTELGAFPSEPDIDYLDIENFNGSKADLRKMLISFMTREDAPISCYYCDGKSYETRHIPVAQQLSAPVKF